MKAIEAKIVILGSQGVGKTSLVVRYIENMHPKEVSPTIGASFFTCKLNLEGIKVKMQVWDTAGQERFKAMTPMYYRNANAALLVFDITNYNSFTDIKSWVQELHRNVQEPMVLTLVGNKCDLMEKRTVSKEEAIVYASSVGGNYYETSAVLDEGIGQVFLATANGLVQLSSDRTCRSIRRYESVESLSAISNSVQNLASQSGNIDLGIPVDSNVEANGIGYQESVSWSIENIAHGDQHRSGWCCY